MDKRKKFHHALLKLYYPPPLLQESQKFVASPVAEAEPAEVLYTTDLHLDANPELGEENDACDLGSEKLTRAQRKRIRKRILKESASAQRRAIIGPLLPSDYEDHNDEHYVCSMQSFHEENCEEYKT